MSTHRFGFFFRKRLPISVDLQRQLQVAVRIARKRDRVLSRVARGAIRRTLGFDRRQQSAHAQVADRIGRDVLPDLLQGVRGGDQLAAARCIDTVEAGRHRGWTADPQVHFLGACRPHHLHDLAARRAAHQRVVYQHDTPAVEDALHRVEFDLDAEVANRLRRLDEGAADIVIANQAKTQRDLRFFRVADGGADAGVGNRHHDVGIDAGFARERAPKVGPHFVYALAKDFAVGPGEIHVLEDAMRQLRLWEWLDRALAVGADDQQLTGFDIAHVGGADQVERAGFRGDRPTAVTNAAKRERPEAVGVARRNQAVFRDQREREGAGDLRHRLDQRILHRASLRPRVQVQHHLGVAVGLEDRAGANEAIAHFDGVDQVAVVADADLAVHAVDQDRLRVRQLALAGG